MVYHSFLQVLFLGFLAPLSIFRCKARKFHFIGLCWAFCFLAPNLGKQTVFLKILQFCMI